MILLADIGSTKGHWALFNKTTIFGEKINSGFNPNYQSDEEINHIISEIFNDLVKDTKIEKVLFYGSGVGFEKSKTRLKNCIQKFVSNSTSITIENDLVGAQKALYNSNEDGIIAILGTGSNAQLYKNKELKTYSNSLGYFLGDEGGGTALGRILIKDYVYNNLPKEVHNLLTVKRDLNYDFIIDNLYRKSHPQKFLASFSKDIAEFKDIEYIQNLLRNNFQEFIKHHLLPIPNCTKLPIRFIGSVAYFYQDILKEELNKFDLNLELCIQNPIESLIKKIQENEL